MVNFTDLTDDERMELARQDDCLKYLVPSDIRVMLGDISRLREALEGMIVYFSKRPQNRIAWSFINEAKKLLNVPKDAP